MKKRVLILLLIIILVTLVNGAGPFQEADTGEQETTTVESDDEGALSEESLPEEWGLDDSGETSVVNVVETEQPYTSIDGTTSPDYTWDTNIGSFSNYQLTNALFTMGFLAQASLISFENNNNLFFGSIFDSSKFQLTLDDKGEAEILQKNGVKDLGKVYIEMDSGNLTQDDVVTFIPDGNDPTYIYYNTTEIEFDDGDVYYYDESVTNKDDTDKSTSVLFDENGFTSVEIHPENNYTIGDYIFYNSGREEIWACKSDSLCDINVEREDGKFTMKGKANVYYQDSLFIESLHLNNEIVLDYTNGKIVYNNNNPNGNDEDFAYFYNGDILLIETNGMTYNTRIMENAPVLFNYYNSEFNSIELAIENGVIKGERFEDSVE